MAENGDDFDWNDDNHDIVQQSVQGVAAYVNARGLITIRQERDLDEDHDTLVVLTLDAARALAAKLTELSQIRQ